MWVVVTNTLLTLGLILLCPLILVLVLAVPKRRKTFGRRMGWHRYPWQGDNGDRGGRRLWVHALSVGEVLAAEPLVNELMDAYDGGLFFTASTLTGFRTAMRIFQDRPVHLSFFPYDWIWAVRKVISNIDPTHVILTETDIWPTFLWELRRRKVPVFLVNLRISDHTWKNYRRWKGLVGKAYAIFDRICVQTPKEIDRLTALSVAPHRICMTGNLKFDGLGQPADADWALSWRRQMDIPQENAILVAGSTHEGEELILCRMFTSLSSEKYALSLIIAPRDPQRSRSIRTLMRQNGWACELFSDLQGGRKGKWPQVVIVDAIGYLKALYRLADVAFVGGSLVPMGGHNPLEPALWGKPVVFGPDMRDFTGVADHLTAGGGACRVDNPSQLKQVLAHLLDHPDQARKMGERALQILNTHRGAVHRTLSFLDITEARTGERR
jgi:3-deoxy-D-manno-octulosonic-acid transferase